jgi:hypothetical protein
MTLKEQLTFPDYFVNIKYYTRSTLPERKHLEHT